MVLAKKRGRPQSTGPDPIDLHVGGRMRLRRTLMGISQETLADKLGLSYQQVQKYESGAVRLGASRLHDVSRVLGISVSFLFENLPSDGERPTRPDVDAVGGLFRRETIELVRLLDRIPSDTARQMLRQVIDEVTEGAPA